MSVHRVGDPIIMTALKTVFQDSKPTSKDIHLKTALHGSSKPVQGRHAYRMHSTSIKLYRGNVDCSLL